MTVQRIISNEEVASIRAEIPEGHRHLRTTITLADGTAWTLQEATVAALVRAWVGVKTHPTREAVELTGQRLTGGKAGYADWQLLETEDG